MSKYEVTLLIGTPDDERPSSWDWEALIGETVHSVQVCEHLAKSSQEEA
jgi:hypothetical protein